MSKFIYVYILLITVVSQAKWQVSPLFKSSCSAILLWQRTSRVLVFTNQKKSKEDFYFYKKRKEGRKEGRKKERKKGEENSTQCLFCMSNYQGQRTSGLARVALHPFPESCTQHLAVKPPQLWTVWASVLCLGLICASVGKMCPKVSEKPKRSYLGVQEWPAFFPHKLMVIASLLYAISTYRRLRWNAPRPDSGGNLYLKWRNGEELN